MPRKTRLIDFGAGLTLLLVLCSRGSGQTQSRPPAHPSVHGQESPELVDMKADLAKMQSLLNQMQAVFPLVGNPTSPANHQLELNIDMWRILINQMQRRVDRMEKKQAETRAP